MLLRRHLTCLRTERTPVQGRTGRTAPQDANCASPNRRIQSEFTAVDRHALDAAQIDVLQTPRIDRGCRRAVGRDSQSERRAAANRAEMMLDAMRIERIDRKSGFGSLQF